MSCSQCGFSNERTIYSLFGHKGLCENCAADRLYKAYNKLKRQKIKILEQMQETIYPTELLPQGTKVQVINRGEAVVVSSKMVTDQHNQPICSHVLEYPNGKIASCNYSFIVRPTTTTVAPSPAGIGGKGKD